MKLSENFSLKEMTQSQTALKNNIDNSPNVTQIDNLQQLCQNILQPLRDDFQLPIKITSGFRSRELAEMIGSNPDKSQHSKGMAADFEIPGVDNRELASWIRSELEFDQLILEFYRDNEPSSGWIHCSYSTNQNRNQSLRAQRVDGKVSYTPWME